MTMLGYTEERCNFISYYSGPLMSLSAICMTLFSCYLMDAFWIWPLKAVDFALILAEISVWPL